MKSEDYIKQMKNVHASDELISKTIENINAVKKKQKKFSWKKAAIGTAAMLVVSVGSVGAYVGITGNTAILQKLGINVSKNYEENKQIINNNNENIIEGKGMQANLVSVALDNSSLVLELNMKLDSTEKYENIDLLVEDISIHLPTNDITESEGLKWTEKVSSSIMEDGTYKIFKYISIQAPALGGDSIWEDMFYEDDIIDCTIKFKGLIDANTGKELVKCDKSKSTVKFNLEKPKNLNYESPVNVNKTIKYKDIDVKVMQIQRSSFGNIISIIATQKNINLDKVNDIQKLKFIIKKSDGSIVPESTRSVNITMDDYANGVMNTVVLEFQLKVDDASSDLNYNIEIIEDENINITNQQIKEVNDSIMEEHRKGDIVLTADGDGYPISSLSDSNSYYIDKYGVYRIDKTSEELCAEYNKEHGIFVEDEIEESSIENEDILVENIEDKKEIVRAIWEKALSTNYASDEYKIESIEIANIKGNEYYVDATEEAIYANINYAVKGEELAGNGRYENGWTVDKLVCVYIDKVEGEYYLVSYGTGW